MAARPSEASHHLRDLGIPEAPQSWYYICQSRDLPKGRIRKVTLPGHDIVVFRGQDGQVGAIHARCMHLRSDLSQGEVCGNAVRCPLHHWAFDRKGRCIATPGEDTPDRIAKFRSRSYATSERHGAIFIHSGVSARYELPFYDGFSPSDFIMSSPLDYDIDVPWYAATMNGWDLRHFEVVHGRRLSRPAEVFENSPHSLRIVLYTEIESPRLGDNLLRWLNGSEVRLEMTVYGGNLLLAQAQFGRVTSYMLFSVHPVSPSSCRAYLFALNPRRHGLFGTLLEPAELAVRRMMTDIFFRTEASEVKGVQYSEANLTERDWAARAYVDWLKAHSKSRKGASAGSGNERAAKSEEMRV